MEMIRVPSEKDFDALPVTKWKIRQPAANVDWPEAIESGMVIAHFDSTRENGDIHEGRVLPRRPSLLA